MPEKQKLTFPGSSAFQCSALSVLRSNMVIFFFSVFALIGMIFHVFGRQTLVMIFAATIFHFTGLQTVALLKKLKRGKTRRWQILTDSSTRLATIAYFKKLFPRCLHFCTQTFIVLNRSWRVVPTLVRQTPACDIFVRKLRDQTLTLAPLKFSHNIV